MWIGGRKFIRCAQARRELNVSNSASTKMTAPKVELGDGLTQYMALADETARELLLSDNKLVATLRTYDKYFRRDLWFHVCPTPSMGFVLFLNAYQMFLAGARTALGGHAVAIFPVLRTALESAAYGFLIEQKPELAAIWINRHRSEADKKASRNAFTFERAVSGLKDKAPDIYVLARAAYEGAIDYGAHPNPKGVFGHVSIDEDRPDGLVAVTHTSLYGVDHIETIRSLCACLDFGLAIIGMISLSRADTNDKQIAELQVLSDAKNAATADYERQEANDREVVVRSPDQCSEAEQAAFVALVVKGGEVKEKYAVEGTAHADTLLWLQDANGMYGVAAIKKPRETHRKGVFENAGVSDLSSEFPLEYGYAFVEDGRRGRGEGRALMLAAMKALGSRAAFATARATNDKITKMLEKNDFKIVGNEYRSDEDPLRMLRLFVRPGAG
jgi:hypothetical protein